MSGSGFDPRLNSVGKNVSGVTINLGQSVMKYLIDGVTQVLSDYLDPNEQIVAPTFVLPDGNDGGGGSSGTMQALFLSLSAVPDGMTIIDTTTLDLGQTIQTPTDWWLGGGNTWTDYDPIADYDASTPGEFRVPCGLYSITWNIQMTLTDSSQDGKYFISRLAGDCDSTYLDRAVCMGDDLVLSGSEMCMILPNSPTDTTGKVQIFAATAFGSGSLPGDQTTVVTGINGTVILRKIPSIKTPAVVAP